MPIIHIVPNFWAYDSLLVESHKLFNENPELYKFVVDELKKQKKFPKDPVKRDSMILKTAEKVKDGFKHDSNKR